MSNNKHEVIICLGTACVSANGEEIFSQIEKEIKAQNLKNVKLKLTGYHGFCQRGPIVVIEPEGIFYTEVKPEDAHEIVQTHLKENKLVERLLYKNPDTGEYIPHYKDIGFYAKQHRLVVLRDCGIINPEKIEEYIARDGYKALTKVPKNMQPKKVIEEIKKSGLRGRGGTGFRDEYEAHIFDKRCPAGVCRALIYFKILPDKYIGCQMCAKICSTSAIIGEKKSPHKIIQEKCIQCGACLDICPVKGKTIEKIPGKAPQGGQENE